MTEYIPMMLELWKQNSKLHMFNSDLINIYEGELDQYIDAALKARLSLQAYEQSKPEKSAINILTKMVNKLSTTYNQPPTRTVQEAKELDQEVVDWYVEQMQLNKHLSKADAYLNMFKCFLIQPYYSKNLNKPQIRIIPNDRFVVYSEDEENELNPTHIMVAGSKQRGKQTYYLYSKDNIIWFNEDQVVLPMEDNPTNLNPLGVLPFIYVNQSANFLTPKMSEDLYKMTVTVPMLLTDLAVSIKFQAFSIMYGIDIDAENLSYSPNVFWSFKSDPSVDKTPSIGSIKPQIDITEVYQFITGILATWMSTKSIRAGSIGNASPTDMTSGLSKLIDDADTTEFRAKQKAYFKDCETELWKLILHYYHPYWLSLTSNVPKINIDPLATVVCQFVDEVPFYNRGQMVTDLKAEVDAKFTTRKTAISKLNPYMTSSQVDEFMAEIDEDFNTTIVEPMPEEQAITGMDQTDIEINKTEDMD